MILSTTAPTLAILAAPAKKVRSGTTLGVAGYPVIIGSRQAEKPRPPPPS